MIEWIRFAISAVLILGGIFCFAVGCVGANSFDFVINRMHAAGVCDTLGSLLVIAGLVVAAGFTAMTMKLVLVIVLLWISSPVSTHLLAMTARHTEESLREKMTFEEEGK